MVSSSINLDLQRILPVGSALVAINAYEILILALVVELATMENIMVIAIAQLAEIDTPHIMDFHIVLINIILVEHIVPPTSP